MGATSPARSRSRRASIPIPTPTSRSSPTDGPAELTGALPQSGLTEPALNMPTAAHVPGGAVIGADPSRGVIDHRHRVFGYENLLVCDGSAVPANPGVNPSLTITALAERAMTFVPPKEGSEPEPAAAAGKMPEPAD